MSVSYLMYLKLGMGRQNIWEQVIVRKEERERRRGEREKEKKKKKKRRQKTVKS